MLEGFPERCSDVHRSDIHDGVFVAHFYTAIYTCGATFHPRRRRFGRTAKFWKHKLLVHNILRNRFDICRQIFEQAGSTPGSQASHHKMPNQRPQGRWIMAFKALQAISEFASAELKQTSFFFRVPLRF